MGAARLIDGGPILRTLRAVKSPGEIALIQHAMNITLGVHREVRDTITPGIAASEVARFIDQSIAMRVPHGADAGTGRRHSRRYRLPH